MIRTLGLTHIALALATSPPPTPRLQWAGRPLTRRGAHHSSPKNSCEHGVTLIAFLILTLSPVMSALAQEAGQIKLAGDDNPFSLQLENIKTNKHLFLVVGQTMTYRVISSGNFEKGRIVGVTDSTVFLESKKLGTVKILCKDLTAIKFTKNKSGSFVLMAIGAAGLLLVAANSGQPYNASGVHEGFQTIFLVISVPLFVAGAALATFNRNKRIDLGKAWVLKVTRAIVPGNIVTVTMKNGEVAKIKVERIDLEKIAGVQSFRDANGNSKQLKKTIFINDILECSRNNN